MFDNDKPMLACEAVVDRAYREHTEKICAPIFAKAIMEGQQAKNRQLTEWF